MSDSSASPAADDGPVLDEGLPVSPSLLPTLERNQLPRHTAHLDSRTVLITFLSMLLGAVGVLIAQLLKHLIWLFTNLFFHARFSLSAGSPVGHHWGVLVILIPVIGGLLVGIMARYGTKAIRGHGIPEAMEQVLVNKSRIPARITWLKPLSAAIAIGTGGPFGAEGPIIATGGALGSLMGQTLSCNAGERKTLLAAGAAAGMAATFGSPVSAVLLAIELLLFEFRPQSIIPVALASATAAGLRTLFEGTAPAFAMQALPQPSPSALLVYILLGGLMGLTAVGVTRLLYRVEDLFERLPLHWMWWPALGAVVVGIVGWLNPRTLGVGYENISDILSHRLAIQAIGMLCLLKLVSWSVALGSGTSGGTLAPLFTIGGGLGALLGAGASWLLPAAGIDLRLAALVCMAALFAGASRALLASAIFAFETTLNPVGLIPLLGGCAAAYLVAGLLSRHSLMTEKIARRGITVPMEYTPDVLAQISVAQAASPEVLCLHAEDTVSTALARSGAVVTSHHGFPVLDRQGRLLGLVTRDEIMAHSSDGQRTIAQLIRRPPVTVSKQATLREAMDRMAEHEIGRLPVMDQHQADRLVGILTRSDILTAYQRWQHEMRHADPVVDFPLYQFFKRRGT